MFVLAAEIKIGNYTFKQVADVNIKKSVDTLSDTASIQLPTKFVLKDSGESNDTAKTIKKGDIVSIVLEYEDVLKKEEFTGYVSRIKPNIPVEIECEDGIWLLRKKTLNKLFVKTTLKVVLKFIIEGTGLEMAGNIPEIGFDQFLLKNVSAAQALQKIKDNYGLTIYLDDAGKLYAGLRQTNNVKDTVIYDLERNVIEHSLEWVDAEDMKIKLQVKSKQKNNKDLVVEVGDSDGDLRTIYVHNISKETDLKKIGESRLAGLKYSGYKGNITTFYSPFATRGMGAKLINKQYPEREGMYFIPAVEIGFGTGGGRRTVELGSKL